MPFSDELGINLEIADPSNEVGTLAWSAERCTTDGILHGGAIMDLADTVGAICAHVSLPEGATTATIESKTNFFRGVSLRSRTSIRKASTHRKSHDRRSD
jgi:uncharacterized protein (TIGR00369 family)